MRETSKSGKFEGGRESAGGVRRGNGRRNDRAGSSLKRGREFVRAKMRGREITLGNDIEPKR